MRTRQLRPGAWQGGRAIAMSNPSLFPEPALRWHTQAKEAECGG